MQINTAEKRLIKEKPEGKNQYEKSIEFWP